MNDHQTTEEEFRQLYEEHADAVYRRCYFKTSDQDIAQDLAQEAFMKTWDYLQKGNDIRHLKAFVFTVANNLIKDYYKKKKSVQMRDMGEFDPDMIADTVENIEAKAEVQQVLEVINRLDDKYREVLVMNLVEGRGPKEIGEILDERQNTISVRIHRGIKQLNELMSDQSDNDS